MSRKRETRRQQRIRKTLQRSVGGVWFKVWGGPFQQAGIADLIGCVEGLFFAFEVKEPDGHTSQLQDDFIDDINDSGGCAAVVTEAHEAVELVKKVINAKLRRSPQKNRS